MNLHLRPGDLRAAIIEAMQKGYKVDLWPESRGGGFVAWKDDEWLLIGCQSERWRKAWNVEEAR